MTPTQGEYVTLHRATETRYKRSTMLTISFPLFIILVCAYAVALCRVPPPRSRTYYLSYFVALHSEGNREFVDNTEKLPHLLPPSLQREGTHREGRAWE